MILMLFAAVITSSTDEKVISSTDGERDAQNSNGKKMIQKK